MFHLSGAKIQRKIDDQQEIEQRRSVQPKKRDRKSYFRKPETENNLHAALHHLRDNVDAKVR
jgi:hypothetical protein